MDHPDSLSEASPSALLAERRRRALERLGDGAALLLPAAPELRVGLDTEVRYRPDAELYYLTGCTEPEAVALLDPTSDEGPFVVFVRPRDPEAELWSGPREGPERARARLGADAAFELDELPGHLGELMGRVDTLYYRLGGGRVDMDARVIAQLAATRKARQRAGVGVRALVDPGAILDDLRIVKSPEELERVRRACAVTAAAFADAARVVRPGAGEWEVEAALEAGFRRRGAWGPAFPTIVASGANATVLHYSANDRRLREGELVLLDGGAYTGLYAGDISRTFPVSGHFSPLQRRIYEIVLAAHARAIAAVRPAATEADVHQAAARVLVEGALELGVLRGDPEELLADRERYRSVFPHRTSHWLGIEVHDVGDYARAGEPRRLEAGMVLTVEPGLYLRADAEEVPAELRGLGIRIEDDVAVTADGAEVLTAELPADPEGVERLTGG
ncbi:MAG TPA: aminopeptidase P N-terminal domain-containing protein [Longimicrobiales bacterium]|nr:aminopeptidase P N-terminal domain-containing protein [Longimicrobiales bacterium]